MEHDYTTERQEPSTQVKVALVGAGVAQAATVGAAILGGERVSRFARRALKAEAAVVGASLAMGVALVLKTESDEAYQTEADDEGDIPSVAPGRYYPTLKELAVRRPTRGSRLLTGISRLGTS